MIRPSPTSRTSFIEPLEARIAPARIIPVGGPDNPNKADFNYSETVDPRGLPLFVNTETGAAAGDLISGAVGGGAVGVADTFYLRLAAGDRLKLFQSANSFIDFLTVTSGNVVAFFIDRNLDNEVQATELVSLSMGRNAGLELLSGIEGDIVTNLNEQGTRALADDTLDMVDLVSPAQNIRSLAIRGGAVVGKILSGGPVANVAINDGLNSLLAGSAAFGQTFDFFPGVIGGNGTLTGKPAGSAVVPGSGVAGASITNVTVNADIVDRIEAGGGGAGARGGILSGVTVANDTDGFRLTAGKGGDGDAVRRNGGAGGSVSRIFVAGQDDNLALDPDLISIRAGDGGSSITGGNGGGGGIVSSVFVGFQSIGGRTLQSLGVLADNVSVLAGAGGAGRVGGAGGGISGVQVAVQPGDGAGDEISVIAGAGGNSNLAAGGRPGVGGSISSVVLRNLAATTGEGLVPGDGADILVQAGDGGTALGLGVSASGGSVTAATVLGSDLQIFAGNGSNGRVGGNGGSLKAITVLEGDNVLAHNLILRAGNGGNGGQGGGGRGGLIDQVMVANGDFANININQGGGDGGTGTGGRGGAGGSVGRLNVTDISGTPQITGTVLFRAGNGGSGTAGGGVGGSILSGNFDLQDMSGVVASGDGGSVLAGGSGNGGAAGYVRLGFAAVNSDPFNLANATLAVTSGMGGSALAGTAGSGGAGGLLTRVVAIAAGTVTLTAGTGGSGAGGAAGRGGSVISTVAFSAADDAFIFAGHGGLLGARAANGGDILGTAGDLSPGAYGRDRVSLIAGDGTHGGRGGSVRLVGFGSSTASGLPAPTGDLTVRAGNGSVEGRVAGAGGSIDQVNGSVSTGANALTLVAAGTGGGGADRAAAGGSITNVSLALGGGVGVEVRFEAGDAGDGGANVPTGAAGGLVSGVQVASISAATIIRHISAGDGGTGTRTGGRGGSINDVTVLGDDIGERSGRDFGFTPLGGVVIRAGGLFAGAGGEATVAGAAGKGLPGNVTNVRAGAIAAIVAGKGLVPEEVGIVDFITVGPDTDLLQASDVDPSSLIGDLNFADGGLPEWHSFTLSRYLTDNLVGAVANPLAVDANKFKLANDVDGDGLFDLGDTPLDGLIVAKVFRQQNINFIPEARFVGGVFYDYDNLT